MRDTPRPGEVFEGHLIEGEIGRGGMGMVLRARSIALDRARAIKVIAPELSADPAYAARFRRESRLAASVEHPNVVTVHAAGEDDGMLFIVMRLVEGVDLHRMLADGPLPPARAVPILAGVGAALDAAHRAGLVHRDVKPANVLIEPRGGGEHVFLTDFGISKPVATRTAGGSERGSEAPLTAEGQVLGTSDYVAPEQVEHGASDARSDVYSLACVAYHALVGEPPFRRESEVATLIAQTKAERPAASTANGGLPAAVDEVLSSGMAIDPAARPATAGAFAVDLSAALGVETAPPLGPAPTGRRGAAPATDRDASGGPDHPAAAPDPAAAPTPDRAEAPTRVLARPWAGSGTRQRAILMALALFAALAAGVLATLLLRGGDGGSGAPQIVTGEVPGGPVGVAVGARRVWVASRDAEQFTGPSGAMYRLRRSDAGQPPRTPPIPLPQPRAVAIGLGSTWVVNATALYRVGGAIEPLRIEVGKRPVDVAVDNRYVWVANRRSDSVTRVDPTTLGAAEGPETKAIDVGDSPRSIATGSKTVWVANAGSGTVSKIRRESPRVNETIAVGPDPTAIAVGPSAVWVSDSEEDDLRKIELRDATLEGEPIPLAAGPSAVAVGLSSVWVASGTESVVERFDGSSGEPIGDPIAVGADPVAVTVGDAAVYTANRRGNSVTRIEPPG